MEKWSRRLCVAMMAAFFAVAYVDLVWSWDVIGWRMKYPRGTEVSQLVEELGEPDEIFAIPTEEFKVYRYRGHNVTGSLLIACDISDTRVVGWRVVRN